MRWEPKSGTEVLPSVSLIFLPHFPRLQWSVTEQTHNNMESNFLCNKEAKICWWWHHLSICSPIDHRYEPIKTCVSSQVLYTSNHNLIGFDRIHKSGFDASPWLRCKSVSLHVGVYHGKFQKTHFLSVWHSCMVMVLSRYPVNPSTPRGDQ